MKRSLCFFLTLALLLSFSACGATAPEKTGLTFTDDLGRQVTLPHSLDKIAVTGTVAQMAVFALCPEKLVGTADPISLPGCGELPVFGQLYGGKGQLNPESLLQAGAQVIIDMGEAKASLAEELDDLQERTAIPTVHINASLDTYGTAFYTLERLLGLSDRAEPLADYCEAAYRTACALANEVKKVSVLYLTGEDGLSVVARGSYHAEALDLLCDNAAVVDILSAKGTGNAVSMEQIMAWDPDVLLFASGSVYAQASADPAWQTLRAVQNGSYFEVPDTPYPWMGFPPGVQRELGLLWLGKVLYPENADYDLTVKAAEFCELFYHCQPSELELPVF